VEVLVVAAMAAVVVAWAVVVERVQVRL
jgi:hypothetical protein